MNAFSSPNSTWAKDAIREIDQGHARGNRKALVVRSKLQTVFRKFGRFTQSHCAPVILVGFIPLIICAFGLTRATLETNAENLWIEVGGRLEEELKYTKKSLGEGYGGTNELLIQTPNEEGINILSVKAMRQHLDAVTRATNVTVELFDQTWTLKDICYTLSLPPMNNHWDYLLPQLLPCVIITPLDCFWEGAKPLGPKELVNLGPLGSLKWTTINPEELVELMQSSYSDDQLPFNLAELSGLLKEAGITSGYVKKPCLDPYDLDCPETAPNYKTKKKPDIGVELTGGCQGFATKFLDWPEELIVGGVVKNKTGIIRSAAAYQSIIMLMGKQQLFEHWQGQAKVGHFEWSEEAASQVLESWKREFTKTINNVDQSKDSTVLAFSSTSFNDLLKDFSQTSKTKVAIGYVLMLIYAFLTLKRWSDGVDSHGALGFGGVLLVTVAVASGLGFCSFIGIKFNAASTQILPFLALGLGVDDMFLLAHTYSTSKDKTNEPVEYCLASTGVSVFLTSFNNMFAFFMAALIPIPALRSFSLQAAIVVVFNFFAVIVIFPAMIAADIKRRKSGRYDLFCFCQRTDPQRISITPSTSVDSSLVLHRYHNSSNSLSDSSAIVQGVSSTVILPGSIQATASQTIHLPNVVTVQASALAEVGGQPVSQRQHRRWHGRKGKQVSESEDIELSATSNVCGGNGVGIGRGKAGASANVVQVQVAGSVAAEQKSSKESASKLPFQGYSRAFKVHPDKSVIDRCSCMDPAASSEQRSKRHAARSTSNDSVVNENARYFAKNYSKDSVINDNSVLFRSREETKAWASAPRNFQFQVSANAVSNGETSMATAECSSVPEPSRTSSSHSRSSSGVESMERASTSVSWCDTQGAFSGCWQKLEFLSLTAFARDHYGPWLQKMPVKIFVLFVFACLFAAGVYGSMRVEKGLDLTDVVPRESPEHRFVEAQFKFFSFYHMAAVTKEDFDYANGQELLYQFHAAFRKIPNIIKTPAGDLPHFWLIYFREWLEGLQKAFDRDWNEGRINYSGWQANASDDGVMAFKLLAQTGEKESVNHSIVRSVRLVSEDGIIRPETFYKYLMVWCSMDYLGYTFSQANIRPVPTTGGHWSNIRSVQTYRAMRVEPPAPPINFSFIPFNLINIRNTNDFIDIIKSVRAISDEFSDKGLPNYPSGVPFTFWEQYIWLGHRLMVAVSIVLATSFVVMAVILCNFWAAMFIVIVLAMITVEVYGFMGLAGIKLSAVPAVTLILSVGVGVEFTVHMCMQFLTSRGDRNQRMQRAVEHVFSPVVDGAVSTLLGVIMLAGSDFDFIVRYFFHLLAALIVIGTINGLVFLPVLLSLAGPGPEVEELAPPRTASSAGSNREFLPGSSCRQRTPPTDSEICIVESIARQEEKSSGSGGRRPRRKKGHHGSNSRGNKRSNPNRCTPPVDSDSSSSTVTRVTTRATVTVEVHTEHTSERSSHPNFRAGAQAGRPFHSEEEIDEEEMHITSLEDYGDDLKR